MKECDIDEEILSLFAVHNSTIKVLNIDCTHNFPKTIDIQLLSSNLSILFLSHSYINDEDATRIGSMLCNNESLQELHLDRNNITVGGAIHIFMGLIDNRSLRYLNIGRQTTTENLANSGNNNKELQESLAEIASTMFQSNKTLRRLSVPVFASHSRKTMFNAFELKIYSKSITEHTKRNHINSCLKYDLKFTNAMSDVPADILLPVVLLPAEEFLSLVQCSSLEEFDLSGYNMTEPTTMLSLVNFLKHNSTMTHLKLFACRLDELQHAPLRKQLFHALCDNQSLTDLSVDPRTASILVGLVDKVNYERHTKGSPLLTIHTSSDYYKSLMTMWNHSS